MVISMENNAEQLPSISNMNTDTTHEHQLDTVSSNKDALPSKHTEENLATLQNEEQFYDAPQSQIDEQIPHYNITETESEDLNAVMDYSDVLEEEPVLEHDNKKQVVDFSTSHKREKDVWKSNSPDGNLAFQFNAKQLKETLLMQLDLIQHQHLAIMEKDKQIIALRAEKEQLEARLSRMERRISVKKRHSIEVAASPDDSAIVTRTRVASPLIKSPLVLSAVGTAKKTETDKNTPTTDKLNSLPVTITSCNDKGFCFENFLKTNVAYLDPPSRKVLCKKNKQKVDTTEKKQVEVPAWRLVNNCDFKIHTLDENESEEDTSDIAYDKRHSKPEQEEKRRKRWDLQQTRQQRQHEMLVQKYIEREKGKLQGCSPEFTSSSKPSKNSNSTNFDTLNKLSDGVYAVEVSEIVPVCAFGYPLPSLAPRELEIPWFSIAKREVQLRTARERLVTRTKKKVRSVTYNSQKRRNRNKTLLV